MRLSYFERQEDKKMLETLRSYWSIISTIITVVAVPAIGYLYKKYKQAEA